MKIKKTSEVTYGEIREFPLEDPCYSNISLAWTTVTTPGSDTKVVQPLQVKVAENPDSSMPDTYFRLSLEDTKVMYAVLGEYIAIAENQQ